MIWKFYDVNKLLNKLGNYVYDICRLMIGRFKFCRMMRYEVVVFNFLFTIYC